MLVEFSVKNFYSIKDKVTLSMVADEQDVTNADVVLLEPHLLGKQDIKLLPSAVIYGPNASGKTTLLGALFMMSGIIKKSNQVIDKDLPITPFLLNEQNIKMPTEFEVIFILDNIRFQYGFSLTKNRIIDEWLYSYPKGTAQLWFKRIYQKESEGYDYTFSKNIMGRKKAWSEETRLNTLFLSKAAENNSAELTPVFQFFSKKIILVNDEKISATVMLSKEALFKQEILSFLKAADIGVVDFIVNEKEITDKKLLELISSSRSEGQEKSKIVQYEIKTTHVSESGKKIIFDLEEESEGTKKILRLAGFWLQALKEGQTIMVDEINDSLHPLLVNMLIKIFHDPKLNKNNAQLIFTTHDASLLARELGKYLFRRDQIWLTDKNKDGSTKLYSLAEYEIPEDEVHTDRSYLSGIYGALPFIDMSLLSKISSKKKPTKRASGKGTRK